MKGLGLLGCSRVLMQAEQRGLVVVGGLVELPDNERCREIWFENRDVEEGIRRSPWIFAVEMLRFAAVEA